MPSLFGATATTAPLSVGHHLVHQGSCKSSKSNGKWKTQQAISNTSKRCMKLTREHTNTAAQHQVANDNCEFGITRHYHRQGRMCTTMSQWHGCSLQLESPGSISGTCVLG